MKLDNSKEAFVNRHGHKASVTDEELKELSIDNEPVESFEPEPMAKKAPRTRTAWSRRRVLIILGVVMAILLLPIIGGEVIAARYRAGTASVKGKMEQIVKNDVMPAQKKSTIKASTLGNITSKVDDLRASICDGALVDNLANFYPRAKTAHDDCIAESGRLAQLTSVLRRLEGEVRYVEGVSAATKTVTTPTSDPYAVISAQQDNWQAARDAVHKINAPAEWQTLHKSLTDQLATVADNWSKLNAAQNAQDKAAFEAAEKSLTDSYEAVRTTITSIQAELKQTQAKITTAQAALRS